VQCSNRGRLLPIHPHPHDEEIFSNWIIELASANVKSVKEFLDLLETPLKPRDFETPNDRAIEVLKEVTGSTQGEIALTFPSSFKAVWKKPLPGDRWHSQYNELCAARVTAPHTLFVCAQYCSRCLALYGCYQVRWRFAIYDCCPIHGLLLRTSCPHCGSQIQDPAQLNGQQIMKPRAALCACYRCGLPLYDVTSQPANSESVSIVRLHDALARNVACRDYFSVLRSFTELLSCPSKTSKSIIAQLHPLPQDLVYRGAHGMRFERLEATMRGIVLRAALRLFDDWPFHFVEVIRSVNAGNWVSLRRDLPNWFLGAVKLARGSTRVSVSGVQDALLASAGTEGWSVIPKFVESLRVPGRS
jgi:hypothetical protein